MVELSARIEGGLHVDPNAYIVDSGINGAAVERVNAMFEENPGMLALLEHAIMKSQSPIKKGDGDAKSLSAVNEMQK